MLQLLRYYFYIAREPNTKLNVRLCFKNLESMSLTIAVSIFVWKDIKSVYGVICI